MMLMKHVSTGLCLLLGAATAACSGAAGASARAGAWRAVTDTVGDTVVVHTVAGSVWGDTVRLERQLTIGKLEGADYEILGDVRGLAVADDGTILVLDRQVPALRRYAPDGTYLGDIGRQGGGPGEYKQPEALVRLSDGRILMRDPGNARINVYAPDGGALPSWRLPSGGNLHTSRTMYVDTADNSYTLILLQGGAALHWITGLAKFTSAGEHHDTLRAPTWDFEEPQLSAQSKNSTSTTNVPFAPSEFWVFSPYGYFVSGVTTDYRIHLLRPQGVLRIERDYAPVPVLAAEKAEREHQVIENFKQDFGSWKWNGPPIPDTKPPFRSVFVDAQGRVWVQVSQPGHAYRSEDEAREEERRSGRPQLRYRERLVFNVFDRDGRYLGPVVPPEDVQTSPEPVVRGDMVWAVTHDDLDVARVVRFRLVGPGSASVVDNRQR